MMIIFTPPMYEWANRLNSDTTSSLRPRRGAGFISVFSSWVASPPFRHRLALFQPNQYVKIGRATSLQLEDMSLEFFKRGDGGRGGGLGARGDARDPMSCQVEPTLGEEVLQGARG